jgi:hypothetical protein
MYDPVIYSRQVLYLQKNGVQFGFVHCFATVLRQSSVTVIAGSTRNPHIVSGDSGLRRNDAGRCRDAMHRVSTCKAMPYMFVSSILVNKKTRFRKSNVQLHVNYIKNRLNINDLISGIVT